MPRARHAKPSRLLDWLVPGRAARRRQVLLRDCLLRQVATELRHLREVADLHEVAAVTAQARADAAQAAVLELRREVARLREELLWAWAEGRVSNVDSMPTPAGARVIDLRGA